MEGVLQGNGSAAGSVVGRFVTGFLSGLQVAGSVSRTLFSRVVPGQGPFQPPQLHPASAVLSPGVWMVCLLPSPREDCRLVTEGPWVGRMGPGPWPRGAGTELQDYFRIPGWGRSMHTWLWRHRRASAPQGPSGGWDCSLTSAGGRGAESRTMSASPETLV